MRHRKANSHLAAKLFLTAFCVALALAAGSLPPGFTQEPEKRKLKVHTFNRMPLKVKQIRNLQREDDGWFRDLEIEVENISDKPIYYVSAAIEFPDIAAFPPRRRADGRTPPRSTTRFWLSFGPPHLADVKKLATSDDIALQPGEVYVFKIPDQWVGRFASMKRANYFPPEGADRMELEFAIISFGNGTGYVAGRRVSPEGRRLTPRLIQPTGKRKLTHHAFEDMPLAIKEVRNLQREDDGWFRDLEIEVENISDKPIYFITLTIEFPNIPAPPPETRPDGSTPSRSITGFGLEYGASRLMDLRNMAAPDDIPLMPGETYVFKIPNSRVQGLESMKRERNLPPEAADKIDIEFSTISFGDGTGYVAGEEYVAPKKKE